MPRAKKFPQGRKPGHEKTGGRKVGTLNKKTVLKQRIAELARKGGVDAYEHFQMILNDHVPPPNARLAKEWLKRKDYAASQLLPYTRPRLAPVVNAPQSDVLDTASQLRAALRQMADVTAPAVPPGYKPTVVPEPPVEQVVLVKPTNGNGHDAEHEQLVPPSQRGLPIRPKRAA